MAPLLQTPTKEVDIDLLVFVERYVTDLLKWDLLVFFANNPDFRAPVSKIAKRIGRSTHSIRPDLGDLALLGILDLTEGPDNQLFYQLTKEPYLRGMALKFANQLTTTRPSI